ncbi:transposable element gene [Prunus dulcis]|uniref:Transposable element protein n=1 Tax=Prunus dulcis TaxID=3755 RepID=A0A4Y1RRL6_PRUDU|nr:transposable element gene [Prunus dulcis]
MRGGEYTSNELGVFCEEHGIIHEVTPPYSPQSNGVVVRKNRTLTDMNLKNSEVAMSVGAPFWKDAINDEFQSIIQNNTWMLMNLPVGNKVIECKWVFRKKLKLDGSIDKYKARLVAKGFTQKKGIDYFDIDSSVSRITNIRTLIALASAHNLVIHQMDVKTAFLNGDLDEELYMEQPEGFIVNSQEHKGCKLVKSLYGLKQAPKRWQEKFDKTGPDIAYAIGRLSRYTHNPSKEHWNAFEIVYNYFRGTMDYSLCYKGFPNVVEGYSDANWITDNEELKSTSGYIFLLGGTTTKSEKDDQKTTTV